MEIIQKSANSYAVVIGEIIDKTSYPNKPVNPWQAIKDNGQSQHFPTKQEAANWLVRG